MFSGSTVKKGPRGGGQRPAKSHVLELGSRSLPSKSFRWDCTFGWQLVYNLLGGPKPEILLSHTQIFDPQKLRLKFFLFFYFFLFLLFFLNSIFYIILVLKKGYRGKLGHTWNWRQMNMSPRKSCGTLLNWYLNVKLLHYMKEK
jgi:hypothetical protein